MINNMCKYTTIFVIVDDFYKTYEEWIRHKLLDTFKKRHRVGKLSLSEAISIMIFYHFSEFKNFKAYYNHQTYCVSKDFKRNKYIKEMYLFISYSIYGAM
jgi:hypothetical protein